MSFQERSLGARAPWSAAVVTAFMWSCSPHDGGGGTGGGAGEGGSAGAATAGGGGASAGLGGTAAAGSSTAGAAGSGGSGSPGTEPVIGCPAATWPEAGFFYLAPHYASSSPDILLSFFSPRALSGDGRVVAGTTRNPDSDNARPVPATFTREGGVTLLPIGADALSPEAYPAEVSCDGSVVLQIEIYFLTLYRAQGGEALPIFYPVRGETLGMDPSGTTIVDGFYDDEVLAPRVWTAEAGAAYLPELSGTELYHVSPDGTLLGSDFEALFKYDRSEGVRQPVGMAPLAGGSSIAVSAAGNAWVQSADTHYDSFLFWRPPAQPRSVTCPGRCSPIDLSGTGEVALFDVWLDPTSAEGTSWLWTRSGGLVELSALFNAVGLGVGGRTLRAVAMSDDARAFAGFSVDSSLPGGDRRFFYAVLPASAYP